MASNPNGIITTTIADYNVLESSIKGAIAKGIAVITVDSGTAEQSKKLGALALIDLDISPGTPLSRLAEVERQLVEIVKALSREARLIIFDEPTISLTARESERLFTIIERLRVQGIAIIYISHILGDVLRLCDDIVVLRRAGRDGGAQVEHDHAYGRTDDRPSFPRAHDQAEP